MSKLVVHVRYPAERRARDGARRPNDASVVVQRPAREMTRAEIEAELEAGGGREFKFPGGKVRYEALMTALSEKKMRGEDAG